METQDWTVLGWCLFGCLAIIVMLLMRVVFRRGKTIKDLRARLYDVESGVTLWQEYARIDCLAGLMDGYVHATGKKPTLEDLASYYREGRIFRGPGSVRFEVTDSTTKQIYDNILLLMEEEGGFALSSKRARILWTMPELHPCATHVPHGAMAADTYYCPHCAAPYPVILISKPQFHQTKCTMCDQPISLDLPAVTNEQWLKTCEKGLKLTGLVPPEVHPNLNMMSRAVLVYDYIKQLKRRVPTENELKRFKFLVAIINEGGVIHPNLVYVVVSENKVSSIQVYLDDALTTIVI